MKSSIEHTLEDTIFSIDQEITDDTLQFTLDKQTSTYSPCLSCSTFSSNLEKPEKQPRSLRVETILEAPTAITHKSDESAITYLNRGQLYGIQMKDKNASDEMITSTLYIDFHSSSHRIIAESYWNYWVTQQKQPDARVIDIDVALSKGISQLNFSSFDKVTFKWRGKAGCRLFVRFKCLSTDFSRIKGVKGIPLRAHMDSVVKGTSFSESCFCKVKLFRDKGAERKNKDDYKQISKQLEKIYGDATEQSLPLMYNASLPYSIFGEVPIPSTIDSFEHVLDDFTPPTIPNKLRRHKRTTSHLHIEKKQHVVSPDPPGPATMSTTESSSIFFNTLDTTNSLDSLLFGDGCYLPTPDLISDITHPSIYDVFTPEELLPDDILLLSQQDYFCSTLLHKSNPQLKRKDVYHSSDNQSKRHRS